MVLTRLILALVMLAALSVASPAAAHENHQREQLEKMERAGKSDEAGSPALTPGATHERLEEHLEAMADKKPKSVSQRLMHWLGRTHPFAVHFPIALFPVAWVALMIARRRGETVSLIRGLIIVAGVSAALASLLGWLTGGLPSADPDSIHIWHRWLGTGLGVAGLLLAVWAWRRREAADGRAMAAALGSVTVALLVQGWLGAALVHGMEHMRF